VRALAVQLLVAHRAVELLDVSVMLQASALNDGPADLLL
jgi:hypothetical protein